MYNMYNKIYGKINNISIIIKKKDLLWIIKPLNNKYIKYVLLNECKKNVSHTYKELLNGQLKYKSSFIGKLTELGKPQCQSWIYFWTKYVDEHYDQCLKNIMEFNKFLDDNDYYFSYEWIILLKCNNSEYIIEEKINNTNLKKMYIIENLENNNVEYIDNNHIEQIYDDISLKIKHKLNDIININKKQ